MTQTITKRVELTAELLDEKFPLWYTHIDLSSLNMASGCSCIAGQLDKAYGNHSYFPDFTRFAHKLVKRIGFRRREEIGLDDTITSYCEVLAFGVEGKRAWTAAVKERLAAREAAQA